MNEQYQPAVNAASKWKAVLQAPLPNFKAETNKLAFGGSRGFQDSEALRQTGVMLESIFTNKLGQADAGREYRKTIDDFLRVGERSQAVQAASQGVQYLKDNYQIGIG
jgi:hypothetical protein